jgi:hypothetical protein
MNPDSIGAQKPESAGVPDVIVDFECERGLLFLVIENIGEAPAYRVTAKFDKEISGIGGEKDVGSMNLFKKLEFLPPRKRIRVFVDSFRSYLARKQPLLVSIAVAYSDSRGGEFTEEIKHDLSIYEDITETL